jgi:multidrug resistance protein, MATE family
MQTLSWKDRPTRELVRLASPIVISSLSASAMTVVDALFVGHLGAWALAGVGITVALTLVPNFAACGVLTGIKMLVAQARGAQQNERAPEYLRAGWLLAFLLSIGVSLLFIALAPVLRWLAQDTQTLVAAQTYYHWRIAQVLPFLLGCLLREYRQGTGDTRGPMIATLAANIVNFILVFWFVAVLHLGVAGAGAATLIACTVETVILIAQQWLHEKTLGRKFSKQDIRSIVQLGGPIGIEWGLSVGSFVAMSMLISQFGTVQMAAHQVCIQIIHFGFMPGIAIGEATSIMAGEAVGANHDDYLPKVATSAFLVLGIYSLALTILFVVCGTAIARAFTTDLGVIQIAAQLLIWAGIWQLADALIFTGRGLLRGAGDVKATAVVGSLITWLVTPPSAWLLGSKLGWGAVGGWIGLCLQCYLFAAFVWWRVLTGRWRPFAERSRVMLKQS